MNFPDRCRKQTRIESNRAAAFSFRGQPLFTSTGFGVLNGYFRIEYGGRGPYVEFNVKDICDGALRFAGGRHVYFSEYRTNDAANIMVYFQTTRVSYAKYRPGSYYIDLLEMHTEDGSCAFDKSDADLMSMIEARRNPY